MAAFGDRQPVGARGLTFDVTDRRARRTGRRSCCCTGFRSTAASGTCSRPRCTRPGCARTRWTSAGYTPGRPPGRRWTPTSWPSASPTRWRCWTRWGSSRAHVVGHDWGAIVGWYLAARHPARLRTLDRGLRAASRARWPLPCAMTRTSARGRRTSRFFQQVGVAEATLLADGGTGAAHDRCAAYRPTGWSGTSTPLREPGALTAALNWYRALDLAELRDVGSRRRADHVRVERRDLAIGRTAARGCAGRVDRGLPVRRADRREPLGARRGARGADGGDPRQNHRARPAATVCRSLVAGTRSVMIPEGEQPSTERSPAVPVPAPRGQTDSGRQLDRSPIKGETRRTAGSATSPTCCRSCGWRRPACRSSSRSC